MKDPWFALVIIMLFCGGDITNEFPNINVLLNIAKF